MCDGILTLLMASMLFVSMEGMAESLDDGKFHQTHHSHSDDADSQWIHDSDGSDHEGDSCEHFCHAHVVALGMQFSLPNLPRHRQYVTVSSAHENARGTAPPTPPPNT